MKVVSFGGHDVNDGENFRTWLTAPGQTPPEVEPQIVGRTGGAPTIGGVVTPARFLVLRTTLEVGASSYTKRELQQLWYAWFVTDVTQALIIADDDGGNQRYVEAMPFSIVHAEDGDGLEIVTTLAVDGDVLWRSVTATSYAWTVTASGATLAVVNGDPAVNDDAYPVITVTPRQYATGANSHRRFVAVKWRAGSTAKQYPVDIVNGGLDTRTGSTHFASATGDDIRVIVDGVEANYWLHNVNTATTKVWVNLDWQAGQAMTLVAVSGDGVSVNGDITNFLATGLLSIDNELIAYTGKDTALGMFTGITRGARGTTSTAHLAGAAVYWIQHEIWIEYGSGSLAAPAIDNSRKPIFSISGSSNTSWDYDEFDEDGADRSGAWAFTNLRSMARYGGNQAAAASPYVELGISDDCAELGSKTAIEGYWGLFNPCGIVSANFQNGEYYYARGDWTTIRVRSSVSGASWTTSYTVPISVKDTWTAWSQNVTLVSGAQFVQLHAAGYAKTLKRTRVEAADVTLTLDSNYTPTVTIGGEMTSYRLQGTITNTTTGDALTVDFGMDIDESLEINTDTHDVTYLVDDTPQYQAIGIVGGMRKHLLRLQPGENTLKHEEEGVVDVDVDIEFERRWRA